MQPSRVSLVLLGWLACSSLLWADPNPLPNRVAAGDVTSRSVVLWAHVTNSGPVQFSVSSTPDFTSNVLQAVAVVTNSMIPVKVDLDGLNPGTSYYYRARAGGSSDSGRFRTPYAIGLLHGLRFGVSGDWRGELAPYPSVENAVAANLDFFVELGDTIYADYPSPAVPAAQARTVDEFRAKHNEVYSSRLGLNALADLRASTAIFAVPDDHEVINNFAGGASPHSDPRFETNVAFINETALYRTGFQVFHEYNPIREEVYQTPADPRTHLKPKLYRTQWFGSDAALFVLDARSFRDAPLPEVVNPFNMAAVNDFTFRAFDLDPATGKPLPHRTMLGSQQLADLKKDLLDAKNHGILWKIVCIGEPIQILGFADGMDRFEGYAAERAELLNFITDQQIRNVVFVSADIHGTVISPVHNQTGPDQPVVPSGAFEVVTGPVAYDKPLGPTAFDVAAGIRVFPGLSLLQALLNYISVPSRSAFEALPIADQDRLFKSIMDVQLKALNLPPTGLDGADLNASLVAGDYVAVHTYGWTRFDIDPVSHFLTVTTYGIPPYAPDQVDASILKRTPQVVSQFSVTPQPEPPFYPTLSISRHGSETEISWPTAVTNALLQATASLNGAEWVGVSPLPQPEGTANVLRLSNAIGTQFYRLRSPTAATLAPQGAVTR